MTQTFDIRFARSAGLAALLELPENVFRWKGDGHLRIDAHGISIGVKRGLSALLGGKHTQRIPTENLRAVYREGDALRVEFQSGEDARVVVPFWADDRDTAAKIVQLLPTRETVELEHSTDVTRPTRSRADWRAIAMTAAVVVVLAAGSWLAYRRMDVRPALAATAAPPPASVTSTSNQDVSALLPEMPDATGALDDSLPLAVETPQVVRDDGVEASKVPSFLDPPEFTLSPPGPLPLPGDYVRSADFVIPIARGPAHEIAQRELAQFQREANQLETDYRLQRDLLKAAAITPDDYPAKLEALEIRWWDMTFRILDNEALAEPELLDLRATMLATARLWRSFLRIYAEGMRTRDHPMIASAFEELSRAQEMQSRARLFLR